MRLLGGDADRAVVAVARAHAQAADRLECRIRDGDGVRTEREGLGEIRGRAQAAGDDQGDIFSVGLVQMPARPGQCGNCRDRNIDAEDQRGGAGPAAASVEDDVVAADIERGVDVLLDVLGRELEADGNAARGRADVFGEVPELGALCPVVESCVLDGRCAILDAV